MTDDDDDDEISDSEDCKKNEFRGDFKVTCKVALQYILGCM